METAVPKEAMTARAIGRSLVISTKHSIEVCKMLRGKPLATGKKSLEDVLAFRKSVPTPRYGTETAHRKGGRRGRYPLTVCDAILKLLDSVEANAQHKGMSTGNLVISHIAAGQGPKIPHHGRHGRIAKRTHVEVVVAEMKK